MGSTMACDVCDDLLTYVFRTKGHAHNAKPNEDKMTI